MRPCLRRSVAAVALLSVWACGLPESTPRSGLAVGGPIAPTAGAAVRYVGVFAWDGAERAGTGYTFENDLGYRFRVDRLRLATRSVQLRACEPEGTVGVRWGVPAARADHVVDDDVSVVVPAAVEDALSELPTELGTGVASGASYCEAFTLAAATEGVGEAPSTLSVAGAYAPRGGSTWIPFEASVPLGDGALIVLDSALETSAREAGAEPAGGVRVVFTRYPALAFEGVRPDRLSPAELAWELLGGLLHTGTATVD